MPREILTHLTVSFKSERTHKKHLWFVLSFVLNWKTKFWQSRSHAEIKFGKLFKRTRLKCTASSKLSLCELNEAMKWSSSFHVQTIRKFC